MTNINDCHFVQPADDWNQAKWIGAYDEYMSRRKSHKGEGFLSFISTTANALQRKYGDAVSRTVRQLERTAALLEMDDKGREIAGTAELKAADEFLGFFAGHNVADKEIEKIKNAMKAIRDKNMSSVVELVPKRVAANSNDELEKFCTEMERKIRKVYDIDYFGANKKSWNMLEQECSGFLKKLFGEVEPQAIKSELAASMMSLPMLSGESGEWKAESRNACTICDDLADLADAITDYDFLEPWEKVAKGVLTPFATVVLSLDSLGKNIVGRKDRIRDAMASNLRQFKESMICKIEERERTLRETLKRLLKTKPVKRLLKTKPGNRKH